MLRYLFNSIVLAAVLCWSCREEILHIHSKRNPSKMVGSEKASEGRQTKTTITENEPIDHRTTALSNSMKLSHAMCGHPRWTGHGGEVWQNVVHWRREWQTSSVFLA